MATWIGSEHHKEVFCRVSVESRVLFEPGSIRWPDLDEESLRRFLNFLPRGGSSDSIERAVLPWAA